MSVPANIICPECETENKPDAKRCVKEGCHYPLSAEKDFDRLANARSKRIKKAKETAPPVVKENEEDEDFFSGLL